MAVITGGAGEGAGGEGSAVTKPLEYGLLQRPDHRELEAASGASAALLHPEGAETAQLDAAAACQCVGDLLEYRVHDQLDVRRLEVRIAGGEFLDEFRPSQRWLPPRGTARAIRRTTGANAIRTALVRGSEPMRRTNRGTRFGRRRPPL